MALRAIAEARPERVLDAGCGDGLLTSSIAAPVVSASTALRGWWSGLGHVASKRGAVTSTSCRSPTESSTSSCAAASSTTSAISTGPSGEVARVLRPGGRLVAIENDHGNMHELWSVVAPERGDHAHHDYRELLGRHLATVDRRDVEVPSLQGGDRPGYLDTFTEMPAR